VPRMRYELGFYIPEDILHVRFEVSTAVTLKNAVFLVITPRGSCKYGRYGGT
jgi:hypothetical protein